MNYLLILEFTRNKNIIGNYFTEEKQLIEQKAGNSSEGLMYKSSSNDLLLLNSKIEI